MVAVTSVADEPSCRVASDRPAKVDIVDDPTSASEPSDNVHDPSEDRRSGRGGLLLLVVAVLVLVGASGVAAAVVLESSSTSSDRRPSQDTAPVSAAATVSSLPPIPSIPTVSLVPTTRPADDPLAGCGDWDPSFGFQPLAIDGLAIWSDLEGWHVRTRPGELTPLSGTVTGTVLPTLSQTEPGQGVRLRADPQTSSWAFEIDAEEGEPVGFDFQASCDQKQFTFTATDPSGAPLSLDWVQLGAVGRATSWPIVAQRRPEGT